MSLARVSVRLAPGERPESMLHRFSRAVRKAKLMDDALRYTQWTGTKRARRRRHRRLKRPRAEAVKAKP